MSQSLARGNDGPGLTLVGGGCRSGKSAFAERLALALGVHTPNRALFYLATGVACDPEMAERISVHRAKRDSAFSTIECATSLEASLREITNPSVILLDSVTTWLANLMHEDDNFEAIVAIAQSLALFIHNAHHRVIAVTDEVGQGIVPEHPLSRRYRDLLGTVNQILAQHASCVYSCTMGIPLRLRPAPLETLTP